MPARMRRRDKLACLLSGGEREGEEMNLALAAMRCFAKAILPSHNTKH